TVSLRVGFLSARLTDDGWSATRAPLYWPREGVLDSTADPVSVLSDLDDGDVPQDFPAIEEGPMVALPEEAVPVAFTYNSRPILPLKPAATWSAGRTALRQGNVDVHAPGGTVLSGTPLAPQTEVVLQLDEPLSDSVGVSELDVDLRFVSDDVVLGHQ